MATFGIGMASGLDVLLAPLGPDDLEALGRLEIEEWSDVAAIQRFYLSNPSCHTVKAVAEGEIAGIGTAIQSLEVGWIQDVGVASKWRRRGIGGSIVECLVENLRAGGCRTILLGASEMACSLYSKLGFKVDTEYVTFAGDLEIPSVGGFGEHIRPFRPGDEKTILDLDREICGEDRGSELREKMEHSFIYADEGGPLGFYFPFVRGGLVEAVDRSAGLELMRFKTMNTKKAVVPRENVPAIVLLIRNGYRQQEREIRMYHGEPFRWRPDCIYGF
jgi:ribosomal protein S18 acetylase RimI-like enzyme